MLIAQILFSIMILVLPLSIVPFITSSIIKPIQTKIHLVIKKFSISEYNDLINIVVEFIAILIVIFVIFTMTITPLFNNGFEFIMSIVKGDIKNVLLALISFLATVTIFGFTIMILYTLTDTKIIKNLHYFLNKNKFKLIDEEEGFKLFLDRVEYKGTIIPLKNFEDINSYSLLNDTDFELESAMELLKTNFKHSLINKQFEMVDYSDSYTLMYIVDYSNGNENLKYQRKLLNKENKQVNVTELTYKEFYDDMLVYNEDFNYKTVEY